MMHEKQELLELLGRYAADEAALDEVWRWLVDHVQTMSLDSPARELSDRLWILLSEYQAGDRDEASIRDELRALRVAA